MKRIIAVFLIIMMLLSLPSCSAKYISSYSATVFIGNAWDGTVTAEIGSFSGRYVWRLRNPNTTDTSIYYDGSISSGNFRVYYDSTATGSGKEMLLSMDGNGSFNGSGGYVGVGGEVYIIIESVGDEPVTDISLYISFIEE